MTLNIAAATFHACVGGTTGIYVFLSPNTPAYLAISALRAYGINGHSFSIPGIIITLSLVATGIDVVRIQQFLRQPGMLIRL